MKTALLLLVAIILAANTAYAAPITDSSCLRMVCPNDYQHINGEDIGSSNPDSVLIDTCLGSPTYNHLFSKRWFYINFPANFYPFNHNLNSGEVKGVNDIDSSLLGFKNRFLDLQDTFGLIFFQGLEGRVTDSFLMLDPVIRMYFERYQDCDFIASHFTNTINSVDTVLYSRDFGTPVGVKETIESNFFVYPNPVKDYLIIHPTNIGNYSYTMEVFSLNGKKVLECKYEEKIDVSMLVKGTYLLKLNNFSIKFIKE